MRRAALRACAAGGETLNGVRNGGMDCTAAEPAWMLRTQSPSTPTPGLITGTMEFDSSSPSQHARKRKANSQETERERLSKRLSLLNIGAWSFFLLLFHSNIFFTLQDLVPTCRRTCEKVVG